MRQVMKKIIKLIAPLIITMVLGGASFAAITPTTALAADCNKGFLGFPAWYDGLADEADSCNIMSPNDARVGGLSSFIWRIVLNIIEIVLGLLGYISAGFILYGGFLFIASNGKPESAAKGRKTMLDAIIGLVIAMGSIAIVSFIADKVIK
jgi:hypothetical protein